MEERAASMNEGGVVVGLPPLRETLHACERRLLEASLAAPLATAGERAAALGIPLRTFFYRLRVHGLSARVT